jgi:hypothetical protein
MESNICSRVVVFGLILLLAFVPANVPGYAADIKENRNETELKATALKYLGCWEKEDYKCVWELMSPNFKRYSEEDHVAFETETRRYEFRIGPSKILKISQTKNLGRVTAEVISLNKATGRIQGKAVYEYKFAKKNGRWVLDALKELSVQ